MHYGAIKTTDIANGPGVRVSLFVSGCRNHCEGCFQPETWNFDFGKPFDAAAQDFILTSLGPEYIRGLTVLGGEPMEPENQMALLPFLKRVRAECPDKDIWLYSGFTLEEILSGSRAACDVTDTLLHNIDVLVDGRFVMAKKNISLRFRGSENQRLIDLKRTLADGVTRLWAE